MTPNCLACVGVTRIVALVTGLGFCIAPPLAGLAQPAGWKPEKNVEIVVGSSAGSALDRVARTVQKLFQDLKMVDSSVVVNKVGGGHMVALTYLNQHAGDGHYLEVISEPLITNRITGRGAVSHPDITPLARLFTEYMAFTVNADSPLKSGKDLADQLRRNPGSLSISIMTARGNANHIALVSIAKAAGADARKLKTVIFTSASAITALAGGHVDVIISGPAIVMPLVRSGKLRILAIAAPRRLGGAFAGIPVWKEHGIDVAAGTWRVVVGPGALPPQEIAFWDGAFSKLIQSREWRDDLEKNLFTDSYMNSRDTRHFLEIEYDRLRAALAELGMVR
ncbi:MAG: tripartite tricarboxylate transporter substrate binding protein [Betaproteobacteria bacterium]|nr:tripartite tricarboxylate transporter substrate binding protein [Betaproteobacteria bacterium]